MENNYTRIRRIIYAVLFVLSLIWISFSGGNVPYMIFYALIVNFLLMLIYMVTMFFSVKIYQNVQTRHITKKEWVPYTLQLNNEGLFACRDISLHFTEEFSEIRGSQRPGHLSLDTSQGFCQDIELRCKYSGTFFVGVDSIEIMDYFKVLKICFPMPQKLKVTVKPRILIPGNLSFLTKYEDFHDFSSYRKSRDFIEPVVRSYVPGDDKNRIHWKNSAKRQELMVRIDGFEEIQKYVIYMDDRVDDPDSMHGIIQCDKLRELTVSMVHAIVTMGFGVEVFLGQAYRREIISSQDFDEFYDFLTEYEFVSYESRTSVCFFPENDFEPNVPILWIVANDEKKSIHLSKSVYQLDVNTFDDIDDFLQTEETR